MKLLLIEDDNLLAESLKDNGYRVDLGASLRAAEADSTTEIYALVIMDLGLPDGSGLDLLKRWRESGRDLPVLILAARDTWEDKVLGLEGGADDYLTKPFYEAELVAGVKALLRRQSGRLSSELTLGNVSLDEANQCVRVDEGSWYRSPTPSSYCCATLCIIQGGQQDRDNDDRLSATRDGRLAMTHHDHRPGVSQASQVCR